MVLFAEMFALFARCGKGVAPQIESRNLRAASWALGIGWQARHQREKVSQLGGESEADASEGSISVTSPIARALIGKSKGETVEVETPGGAKVYQIRKVEWLGGARHR